MARFDSTPADALERDRRGHHRRQRADAESDHHRAPEAALAVVAASSSIEYVSAAGQPAPCETQADGADRAARAPLPCGPRRQIRRHSPEPAASSGSSRRQPNSRRPAAASMISPASTRKTTDSGRRRGHAQQRLAEQAGQRAGDRIAGDAGEVVGEGQRQARAAHACACCCASPARLRCRRTWRGSGRCREARDECRAEAEIGVQGHVRVVPGRLQSSSGSTRGVPLRRPRRSTSRGCRDRRTGRCRPPRKRPRGRPRPAPGRAGPSGRGSHVRPLGRSRRRTRRRPCVVRRRATGASNSAPRTPNSATCRSRPPRAARDRKRRSATRRGCRRSTRRGSGARCAGCAAPARRPPAADQRVAHQDQVGTGLCERGATSHGDSDVCAAAAAAHR